MARLTKNQKQYLKELRRLKRGLYRYTKYGIQPTQIITEELPKRVTKKALQNLQKLKPLDIVKTFDFVAPDTGEVIKYNQLRQLYNKTIFTDLVPTPKEPRMQAPSFSKVVISNFKAQLTDYPAMAQPLLLDWLEKIRGEYGDDAVAQMLEQGAQDGNIVNYQIAYNMDLLMNYISAMLDYLPEMGELTKQSFMDAFESGEDWESPL